MSFGACCADAEDTLSRIMSTYFQDVCHEVQIQGAFAVSAKTGVGIDKLKKAICSCAQEWLSRITVPSSYHHFLELLEQKPTIGQGDKIKNKILLWKDIQFLVSRCTHLTCADEVIECLQFLHGSGLIVFISNVGDNLDSKDSQAVVITDTQVSTSRFIVQVIKFSGCLVLSLRLCQSHTTSENPLEFCQQTN